MYARKRQRIEDSDDDVIEYVFLAEEVSGS